MSAVGDAKETTRDEIRRRIVAHKMTSKSPMFVYRIWDLIPWGKWRQKDEHRRKWKFQSITDIDTLNVGLKHDVEHKRDNEHQETETTKIIAEHVEADSMKESQEIRMRNLGYMANAKAEDTKRSLQKHLEPVNGSKEVSNTQVKSDREENPNTNKEGSDEVKEGSHNEVHPILQDQESTKPLIEQIGWKRFIDHHHYQYLINPIDVCSSWNRGSNLTLLVLVPSAPMNFVRRGTIRRTWMKNASSRNLSTITLFLIGATNDKGMQLFITQEAERWHDIIQEDFVDSYLNLTLKTVMALKWASNHCPNVAFVMKSDDDVMLNIANLTADLGNAPLAARRKFVTGRRVDNIGPVRDNTSKWYTPEWMYPGDKYPTYPEGHAYIMSSDAVEALYRVSTTVPIFPWEDVFIGMCMQEIGLKVHDLDAVNLNTCLHSSWSYEDAFLKTSDTLLALQHGYMTYDLTPEQMDTTWSILNSRKWPYTEKGFCADLRILEWPRLPDIWKLLENS
nr:beta-1,3-galactosyltransferase 1-like [Lytechinus pictus]